MPERGTRRQGTRAFAVATLLGVLGAHPAAAADKDKDVERYAACLRQIGENAQNALKTGEAWRGTGGGAPALHCVALALAALGQHSEAAVKLESLADNLANERPELVPDVLAQAAQSWARASRPERAMKALDRAREDRAAPPDGTKDKNASIDPARDDALTLRATIRRKLPRQAEARADADKAVALNPRNADAWLERGILRHLAGDEAGAGQDWRQALEADPDSAAARSAAANLAQQRPTQ